MKRPVVVVRPTGAGTFEYVTRGGARVCPDVDQAVVKALRYARRIGGIVRVWP